MIVAPKIRGFICTTAHPDGCAKHVAEQIAVVRNRGPIAAGPKKVLVIGSSTGYGLASRIASAIGSAKARSGLAGPVIGRLRMQPERICYTPPAAPAPRARMLTHRGFSAHDSFACHPRRHC